MTFRTYRIAAALSTVLAASITQPALADAPPPGFKPNTVVFPKTKVVTPSRSGGENSLPPINSPALKGGVGFGLIFDSPVTGYTPVAAPSALMEWRGSPSNWNPPGLNGPGRGGGHGTSDTYGDGHGASCERGNASHCRPKPPKPPKPNEPGVPGPLPVLGAAAAWGWAKRLRKRTKGKTIQSKKQNALNSDTTSS